MTYTKYLNWTALALITLVPFIAFIIASGGSFFGANWFFPFITGKNFSFRIIVELLVLVYILLALRDPAYRPKTSWIFWSVTAFIVWMGIATIFSVDPVKSFWSNFERMEGYVTLLHLYGLFLVTGAVLTVNRWWGMFFRISIAASMIMGFYGIAQLINPDLISSQSGQRIDTTFGNAAYLAVYMLIHIFLTLFMLLRERTSVGMQVFYGSAIALQVISLFFTESRGAALGFVGGLIVMAIFIVLRAKGRELAPLRKVALGSLAAIVLLGGIFFAFKDTQFVQQAPLLSRLSSISLDDPTTMSRFTTIWPMAIKGGLERPITGWGQENFSYIFNSNYNPAMYGQEQWFDRAHNQFLDWLVAGGVPAFLLYVSFFVLAVWVVLRSPALSVPEQAALLGLLVAYGFNNLFVFDNIMSVIYFYLILAYVHSLSRERLPKWMFLSKPMSDQGIAIAAPIVAVVMIGGLWMLNVPGITRASTLIDAITTTNAAGAGRDPKENLAAFKLTLTQGSLGKQEVVEQLYQYASNSIAPNTGIAPDLKQQYYDTTRAAGESMLAERKNDARLELFTGVFYSQFGQYADSLKFLNQALEHSPNKQQILFQIGLINIQRGDAVAAVEPLQKAFDLAPQYKDARIFYALALFVTGQNAAADKLLMDGFGTVLLDDDRLLQVYTNTKQVGRIIDIWKLRVEKDPQNVEMHLGLASAYFAANNVPATIAELQKIAQLNPQMAAQMQTLITQIQAGTLKPE
ncbi:MAG: O-antigen ligase family protein [Candidatus Pacebacteria bacterium]|nr:O-antigen ligase family protein [Candidatus Paceibacterota bacterium]